MTIALITILGVALGGLLAQVQWAMAQIGHRLDRIEDRLAAVEVRVGAVEVKVTEIGTRLDDHITAHPGPTERLVR
jgi:hypothetical protein